MSYKGYDQIPASKECRANIGPTGIRRGNVVSLSARCWSVFFVLAGMLHNRQLLVYNVMTAYLTVSCFLLVSSTFKVIKLCLKQSYHKQNLTLVVISYEQGQKAHLDTCLAGNREVVCPILQFDTIRLLRLIMKSFLHPFSPFH